MEQRDHRTARSRVLVSNAKASNDIQYALRDAGFEVIPTPDTRPEAVYTAAIQEDVPAAVLSLPADEGLRYIIASYRAFQDADTDLVFTSSPRLHKLYAAANEHIVALEDTGKEVATYLRNRYDWSQYEGIGSRSDTVLADHGLVPGHADYDEVYAVIRDSSGDTWARRITSAAKRADALWEPQPEHPDAL